MKEYCMLQAIKILLKKGILLKRSVAQIKKNLLKNLS